MHVLLELWLPIVVAAIFVFVVSCVIHMALPWHKGDFRKIPNEDKVLEALRPLNIPPGDYMVPRCDSMQEMKTPEFKAKRERGPVFTATFTTGEMAMGKSMFLWFVYLLVISYFTAYAGAHAGAFGHASVRARHILAVTAFLGYGGSLCQASIWYKHSWCSTFKSLIDSAIYAAVTLVAFLWLGH